MLRFRAEDRDGSGPDLVLAYSAGSSTASMSARKDPRSSTGIVAQRSMTTVDGAPTLLVAVDSPVEGYGKRRASEPRSRCRVCTPVAHFRDHAAVSFQGLIFFSSGASSRWATSMS